MKRIALLTALAALFAASCSNTSDPNPTFKSRGLITGPDFRKCSNICCGGWWIEIEGKTYRFLELPANTDVRLTEANYPIPVRLSWSIAPEGRDCYDPLIVVHAIMRE